MSITDILEASVDQTSEHIGIIPLEHSKSHAGKAFGYDAVTDLTLNVPAYHAIVTGATPIHLKEIGVISSKADVTVTLAEDAAYTGGTAVTPVASNRKLGGIKRFKHTIATPTFDAAVALSPQPADGLEPTIEYVRNGANLIHPAIAVAITTDPLYASNSEDYRGYGVEVKDVEQVDIAKAMSVVYKAKTVVEHQYSEQKTTWAVDTAYKFTQQDYAIASGAGAPTVHAVYNGLRALTLTTEYTVDQITDVGADQWKWTITIVDGETIDAEKPIFFVYSVEKSETPDYTQALESAGWGFDYQRIEVGSPTGTFEVGEEVEGTTSRAKATLLRFIEGDTDYFILGDIEGVFQDEETLTGATSNATLTTASDPETFNWYAFDNQSYDDSAITVATVYNDTEALSATVDYTFALATTWKITLKETAKTSESLPLIIVYSCQTAFAESSGVTLYTGPTVTGAGTVVETYYLPGADGVGQSSAGAGAHNNWEMVLKPNSKYLIKSLSSVSQKILIRLRWYLEE